MKPIYLLSALTIGAASNAYPQGNNDPLTAMLDVSVVWADYDTDGTYTWDIVASDKGDLLLEYYGVTHSPWGPPAYYTMTGTDVLYVSITENRFELRAMVETASWTFGQPQYGTQQIDILVERGFHRDGYQRMNDVFTYTGQWPRPVNGEFWEFGGGGLDGYTSSGTYQIVPEPTTFVALGLGLALLLKRRK